jgi:glycosyltransferase involved in cell wall biosynthesis
MGVYNGAETVAASIDSILSQQVNLEFIIVNDGSTDDTAAILEQYRSTDHRVIVVNQENRGLTRALVSGCTRAAAAIIARQDCGDISAPERLRAQLDVFTGNADVVLVSTAVRALGPGGETLFTVTRDCADVEGNQGQLCPGLENSPAHHGSAMFRRSAYVAAGGYRTRFRVAQDIDLWSRLLEQGRHVALQEVLYDVLFTSASITQNNREEQLRNVEITLQAARLRKNGSSEDPALARLDTPVPRQRSRLQHRLTRSRFNYFIGSCLRQSDRHRARDYFRQALVECPLNIKALYRLAQSLF